ncbi:MAG: DNA mismatch repair protein MutS [Candidatus Aminicenantes bacterium]|jgi:DNA mismatch repair protein MutS
MSIKKANTPMMEQYLNIKRNHPDSLLFFRLGDFYEMFYEDAKKASPVLEIALTSRQKVPMCGVPYHAAKTYLTKLLKHGFKVAICEQVEDPKQAKGVVRRDVVKVLTPGTAIELDIEEDRENTFISSLVFEDNSWGLATIDLVSGELMTAQSDPLARRVLSDDLYRFSPKEIIYPEGQEANVDKILMHNNLGTMMKSPQEDWIYDLAKARSILMDHFQVKSLEGYGLEEKPLAVRAAGALLYYLKKLRQDTLLLIHRMAYIQPHQHMILDTSTIKNLELVKNLRDGRRTDSLLDIVDFTETSMGARLLRSWLLQPLRDIETIEIRLESVAELLGATIERHDLRDILKEIYDLERLNGKISLGVANARDLVALHKSLIPLPQIQKILGSFSSQRLQGIFDKWDNARDLVTLIERSIKEDPAYALTDGGIIKEGYSSELDELRNISRSGKSFITQMEKKEKERTGISSLKIRFNKVFGYYIDVTKPNLSMVPPDYIRKQTLVNSERFITPELKEYEDKVLNAEERIGELEYELFLEIRAQIAAQSARLMKLANDVASLDVLCSMAELASQRNYTRPVVNANDAIKIIGGRHPVIEKTNAEPFVPNDVYVDRDADQILIVTGPNMGGKSTYLRQVALICILAQMGSFVPADETEVGVVDRIFTRIGAMDFLTVGQSTFMVEMLEAANILNNATARSLILLDEIGRGTSTFDGLSIAWAIAEYLHENEHIRAKTLFATHYHELTELALTLERIKNYHVSVKEWKDEIIFLRKIVPGPSDQSYGIHVAKLAGIPRPIIERAKEVLFNLEKKELDDAGVPKIAYHSSARKDKSQLLLFEEDREREKLESLREEIVKCDLNALTPLEALNLLEELQNKLKNEKD